MNKKRFKECILLATFFLIVLVLYLIGLPIECFFHKITGLYCPGCGVTRMLVSLLTLNFKQAFCYNELLFCLLFLTIIYNIYKIIYYLKNNKWLKLPSIIWYILIILLIIYGILRNISYFSFLQP